MVGKALTKKLLERGDEIIVLTRKRSSVSSKVRFYHWDAGHAIEPEIFRDLDHIIHLAGAPVADKRWTKKRKKELVESRVGTAATLKKSLPADLKLKSFVSASGINYYGTLTTEHIFTESDPPGEDFLARLSVDWEAAADHFSGTADRVVKFRIPAVLSPEGGALPVIARPVRMGFGAVLGSGKQYFPWVHIDDLVSAMEYAIENPLHGAYNVVAVDQKELTIRLAEFFGKKIRLPHVPGFALQIILGKRASLVLNGSRASSEKLKLSGFSFDYPKLDFTTIYENYRDS